MVAHRKVGAPDRPLKQDVADDREVRRGVVKYDVARRVARAMDDVQGQIADGHCVAIDQPAVRFKNLAVYAVILAIFVETTDPEAVGFMWPFDRNSQLLGQCARLSAMVNMAVGYENFLNVYNGLCDSRAQFWQVTAGVNQRRLVGRGAPDQTAILLQRRHRDDRGAHRWLLGWLLSFGHGHSAANGAQAAVLQASLVAQGHLTIGDPHF